MLDTLEEPESVAGLVALCLIMLVLAVLLFGIEGLAFGVLAVIAFCVGYSLRHY